MPKALCIFGIVIAVLLLLIFGFDLVIGVPFGKASLVMDAGIVVACGLLGYVSWTTFWRQV
jgi:hypothetical protein